MVTVVEWCEDIGSCSLVVAPQYRSMGLAAAMLEAFGSTAAGDNVRSRMGLDALIWCSFGTHPSGARLARRFGAGVRGLRHWLRLPSRDTVDWSGPLARQEEVPTDIRPPALAPSEASMWHAAMRRSAATAVEAGPGVRRGVIHHVEFSVSSPASRLRQRSLLVDELREQGAPAIEVAVDATDDRGLAVLRSAGFRHDRTDTLIADTAGTGTLSDSTRALAGPRQA